MPNYPSMALDTCFIRTEVLWVTAFDWPTAVTKARPKLLWPPLQAQLLPTWVVAVLIGQSIVTQNPLVVERKSGLDFVTQVNVDTWIPVIFWWSLSLLFSAFVSKFVWMNTLMCNVSVIICTAPFLCLFVFLALLVFTQQSYCIGSGVCRPFVNAGFSEPFYGYKTNFMGSYQSTQLQIIFLLFAKFSICKFYDLFLIFVNMELYGSQKFQNATPPTHHSQSFQSSPIFFSNSLIKVTFSDFWNFDILNFNDLFSFSLK